MSSKIQGALKAVAPLLLSLAYIGLDALFGVNVDITQVQALVAGVLTGVVVYFVPNAAS